MKQTDEITILEPTVPHRHPLSRRKKNRRRRILRRVFTTRAGEFFSLIFFVTVFSVLQLTKITTSREHLNKRVYFCLNPTPRSEPSSEGPRTISYVGARPDLPLDAIKSYFCQFGPVLAVSRDSNVRCNGVITFETAQGAEAALSVKARIVGSSVLRLSPS